MTDTPKPPYAAVFQIPGDVPEYNVAGIDRDGMPKITYTGHHELGERFIDNVKETRSILRKTPQDGIPVHNLVPERLSHTGATPLDPGDFGKVMKALGGN